MNTGTKYEAKYLEQKKKEKKTREKCQEVWGVGRWNPDLRDLDAKDSRKEIQSLQD